MGKRAAGGPEEATETPRVSRGKSTVVGKAARLSGQRHEVSSHVIQFLRRLATKSTDMRGTKLFQTDRSDWAAKPTYPSVSSNTVCFAPCALTRWHM